MSSIDNRKKCKEIERWFSLALECPLSGWDMLVNYRLSFACRQKIQNQKSVVGQNRCGITDRVMPGMRGALRDRLTFLTTRPTSRRSDEDQRALCATAGRARRVAFARFRRSAPARAVNLVDRGGAGRNGMGLAGIMARMRCA